MLEHDDLRRTLRRIAHEIAEKNPDSEHLAVVGIHTRGAVLARRLHVFLGELTGTELPIGDLDISFYRDDVGAKAPAAQPVVHASHIDFDLADRTVVLVDDVLYTGRTVRAAIEAIPEPFREAVVLRDLEDLSYAEIAEVTGVAVGTVMSRLSRGRGLLAKALLPMAGRELDQSRSAK